MLCACNSSPPAQRDALVPAEGPDARWGYVGPDGLFVVLPRYTRASPFQHGLAAVCGRQPDPDADGDAGGVKCGFIDTSGRPVIPLKFDDVRSFSEGLAGVRQGALWGFIDAKGSTRIPFEYDDHPFQSPDSYTFVGGRAAYRVGTKMGVINSEGRVVVNPIYDDIRSFSGEYARVQRDRRWGYIDRSGTEVIAPKYSEARDFFEQRAAVRSGYLWGYIDPAGREVIPVALLDAGDFSGGSAAVRTYAGFGLIDQSGAFLIAPTYEDIYRDRDGNYAAVKAGITSALQAPTVRLDPQPTFEAPGDAAAFCAAFRYVLTANRSLTEEGLASTLWQAWPRVLPTQTRS
jgi:hypothetical protein